VVDDNLCVHSLSIHMVHKHSTLLYDYPKYAIVIGPTRVT